MGDPEVLAAIAVVNGLDGDKRAREAGNHEDAESVMAEVAQAQAIGVTGVPTFILVNRYGVVGAQSPAFIADAIRKVAAETA